MAGPSNKGPNKRGGGSSASRHGRSRNTTPSAGNIPAPMSTPEESTGSASSLQPLSKYRYDDIVEFNGTSIPDSKTLGIMMEKLRKLSANVESTGEIMNKGMRDLAKKRKRFEQEAAQKQHDDDEAKEQAKLRNEIEQLKKSGKKRDITGKPKEERPLAQGAHAVAPQDGSHLRCRYAGCDGGRDKNGLLAPGAVKRHEKTCPFRPGGPAERAARDARRAAFDAQPPPAFLLPAAPPVPVDALDIAGSSSAPILAPHPAPAAEPIERIVPVFVAASAAPVDAAPSVPVDAGPSLLVDAISPQASPISIPDDDANINEVASSSSLSVASAANSPEPPAVPSAENDSSDDDTVMLPNPSGPPKARNFFGPDPSKFKDDVDYEIHPITSAMTYEEACKSAKVAYMPTKTFEELGCVEGPDKDLSNAKPANQVQFNTFQSAIEPYMRPLNEDDVAFLRERGDRVTPFTNPRRGRNYKLVWDEEDGIIRSPKIAPKPKFINQKEDLEDMPSEAAEIESMFNGGLQSRLTQLMRPENRMDDSHYNPGANGSGGGYGMNATNDHPLLKTDHSHDGLYNDPRAEDNDDLNDILDVGGDNSFADGFVPGAMGPTSLPPATQLPGSSSDAHKKYIYPKLDYAQSEEACRRALVHIGLLDPAAPLPDYTGHFDDDISARIRYLQRELKESIITNGARKARIMDITKLHMARQEFDTVGEDLDNQLNTNYAKRTRTMGKKSKAKKPHASVGGSVPPAGTAKSTIGDAAKILLDRKNRWNAAIGPVFEDASFEVPRAGDNPEETSIFKPEDMAPYIEAERLRFAEDAEADE